ncbi:MAG: FitA-like ribbon-helix-helix domain-containing protein [Candidatus Promineifilaceae bacterium]|jgi:plasmid stability protein
MGTLTIKNVPNELYERLKRSAEMNRRSMNSEVIVLLEQALGVRPFSAEETLEEARRLREANTGYVSGEQELVEESEQGSRVLMLNLDPQVYEGLIQASGGQEIGRLVEELVRTHVLFPDLEEAYRQMAEQEDRERKALEWADATLGDVSDEAR